MKVIPNSTSQVGTVTLTGRTKSSRPVSSPITMSASQELPKSIVSISVPVMLMNKVTSRTKSTAKYR